VWICAPVFTDMPAETQAWPYDSADRPLLIPGPAGTLDREMNKMYLNQYNK
jgi:hypothetical protein